MTSHSAADQRRHYKYLGLITCLYVAMQLVSDVGFEAVDAGPLRVARSLEELAVLWIHLAYNAPGLDRNFAFAIVRR